MNRWSWYAFDESQIMSSPEVMRHLQPFCVYKTHTHVHTHTHKTHTHVHTQTGLIAFHFIKIVHHLCPLEVTMLALLIRSRALKPSASTKYKYPSDFLGLRLFGLFHIPYYICFPSLKNLEWNTSCRMRRLTATGKPEFQSFGATGSLTHHSKSVVTHFTTPPLFFVTHFTTPFLSP